MMNATDWREHAAKYRKDLLEDTLPFWLSHAVDSEGGGFVSCVDRDGAWLDDDKSGWVQGRFTWLLARLHAEIGPRKEWLEGAQHGIEFMRRCGYDEDRRMWFHLDRSGRGLRKRRYAYTEFFAAMAFAEWSRCSGDEEAGAEARRLFQLACDDMRGGRGPAKVEPIRPGKALGVPMITLGAAHVLEDCLEEPGVEEERTRAVAELRNDFFHPELEVLLECVGPDGELIDHLDGRHVNPGHSIEAAWFLMEEARRRGAPEVLTDAVRVLDGAWALGWDDEHGGLLSLVDVSGRPVQELWAELKLWWPHCEAIIACLCAARATGEERHVDRWRQVNDWAHAHFPDPEHGEWFGYLRRDGSVMNEAKGNMWKGPFHVPRMQWMAAELCDAMAGSREE